MAQSTLGGVGGSGANKATLNVTGTLTLRQGQFTQTSGTTGEVHSMTFGATVFDGGSLSINGRFHRHGLQQPRQHLQDGQWRFAHVATTAYLQFGAERGLCVPVPAIGIYRNLLVRR